MALLGNISGLVLSTIPVNQSQRDISSPIRQSLQREEFNQFPPSPKVGHGCQQTTKMVLRPKTYFQVNIYASPLRSRRVRSTLNFTALISNSTWSSPSTPTPIRPWNHPLKVNTDRKSHCYSSDKQDAMEVPRLVCPPDDYIIGLENLISKVATAPCFSSATSFVARKGGGGSFVTRGDENIE